MLSNFIKTTSSLYCRFQKPNLVAFPLRSFSQQFAQSQNNKFIMEKQIRESLAKLQRLSQLIPDDDPRTAKARTDYEELHEQFGQIMFEEENEAEASAQEEEELTEHQAELEAQKREMKTKKLMTVAKSKYFMLKANFPKQALQIDSEPIINNHTPAPEYKFGSEP